MLKSTPRVSRSAENGGPPNIRTLFETEEAALLRYAFSLTGRRAVAEEIVQDAFLQLHAHWDEVDAPRAWLFRAARNKAFTYHRDNKREVLGSDDCEPPSPQTNDVSADVTLSRLESLGALRQTLSELNPSDRQLIQLKYFEGLKYSEISDQTGLSVGNIGYRLHHILKGLAVKLRPLGIDGES